MHRAPAQASGVPSDSYDGDSQVCREQVLNSGFDNKQAISNVLAQMMLELFEEYDRDREKVQPQWILCLTVDLSCVPRRAGLRRGSPAASPYASTFHDLGSTISHKRQIMALHLQGHFLSEIARMINHHPRNVDRYLRDLEGVHDMARDGVGVNP